MVLFDVIGAKELLYSLTRVGVVGCCCCCCCCCMVGWRVIRLPLYYYAKLVLLLYLLIPQFKGTDVIFDNVVDPTMIRCEERLTHRLLPGWCTALARFSRGFQGAAAVRRRCGGGAAAVRRCVGGVWVVCAWWLWVRSSMSSSLKRLVGAADFSPFLSLPAIIRNSLKSPFPFNR